MEKGKITSVQMMLLLYPAITATAILLVPGVTAQHARQDMWLSPVWASLIGFLTVYVSVQLHRLYPQKTPIEYSIDILGKFLGKLVGLLFVLFYFHVTGIIVREYGEFVVGNFLFYTPIGFVMGTMVFVCAVAVRSGIAALGRLAQILVPVVIVLLVFIVILLFPDMDLENMLPMLEKGLLPSIRGAVTPQSWFSECFLMAFLLPHVIDEDHGRRWGNIAVVSIMLTLLMTNLATLFVFGNTTANFVYPVMSVVRYISIADFLEHVEAVVMALWVVGVFLKISVFYYVVVIALARWLNLSQYEPLVFSVGLLLFLFSNWSAKDLVELTHFLGTTGSFYLTCVQTVIPFLLLLAARWRKRATPPPSAVSHEKGK
ncbi:spore gernimation protein [Geobacillus sp. 46C-IIa]|uniref:GerAB/ArcD/ProY family transporter n=1 Tax=Geobacillus sp. 46C-IIa TaxID=1963025 RepID=UPI0009C06107|nr:endospore germination permease [Geobacillus sp. 46C-IIa]OQP05941.1 spore gernimation protein [Geobacillus sp. 46C-IIa]QNU29044.1 endospore germination permease [Geobacillus sp. 46C-IIa]